MNREQHDLIEHLRSRLRSRAWLLDDDESYRQGVDDALDELELMLDVTAADRLDDAAREARLVQQRA